MKGSPTIHGVVPAIWPGGLDWVGRRIDIAGIRYTISSVDLPYGDGIGVAPTLTLTEPFKEATGSYSYVVYAGLMDWAEPPKYCYAYYNPTSGHCSLKSPTTEIAEKDQTGVTPQITGIAYSPTAFNQGYTQIKIFRSAKNGAVMVAIDVTIANSNIPGTTSISVFIEKNPFPYTGTFDVSQGALPFVHLRAKIGESSPVRVVVAAGGKHFTTAKEVKVTIGGCGG